MHDRRLRVGVSFATPGDVSVAKSDTRRKVSRSMRPTSAPGGWPKCAATVATMAGTVPARAVVWRAALARCSRSGLGGGPGTSPAGAPELLVELKEASQIFPGAHAVWAVCAGRSVRNFWRAIASSYSTKV
jgi:hypothetical protein